MASDERIATIGFINIVATPHPPGVYPRLLTIAAGKAVNFWGDQFAAITKPRQDDDNGDLYVGRLVIWTEIDEDAPAIQKRSLTESSLADLDFNIPNDVGFNGKVFTYVLNAKRHVFCIELKNEFGKMVSPARTARILELLLSPEILGMDAELVEVTVIPEEDALTKVLSLRRLDRILIVVKRPNADDVTSKANAILAELDAQNVKRQDVTLVREARTESIVLNERNQTLAEVGSTNGFVEAKGRTADGTQERRSTKEYPKVVKTVLSMGQSALATIKDQASRIRANRG